jgi:DnaJ like chaperone protein
MFERTDPRTLKTWLIIAAVIYLLLPYDLFPDFLGLPGRVDDLLLMAWLAWYYRSHVRRFVANGSGREAGAAAGKDGADPRSTAKSRSTETFDPYSVLGISPSASSDAITAAYRARMSEYHPDKVAHLGEELQKLAHAKSQEIQLAYRQLRK